MKYLLGIDFGGGASKATLLSEDGRIAAECTEDGDNAFHCDNSPESLAAAITAALPRCAEVGERARATIPLLWSEVVARARARYCELIEEKSAKK